MILRFPSIDVLQLALTSEIVDQRLQCAPARVAQTDDDAILLETSSRIGRSVLAELKKLGVQTRRSANANFHPIVSWHEALPPVAVRGGGPDGEKAEVLLEIEGEEQLPVLVSEMLRLGNDRQSFRYVNENGKPKTLLRVTAPPYYTLLRAIDPSHLNGPKQSESAAGGDGGSAAVSAYVQQCPRVWVQAGYQHPLGNRLNPPAGKWLLIARQGRWRFLTEGAFRDIYEVLEFTLPDAPANFVERELRERIRVPVELVVGSSQEAAELWVLAKDAMKQVEKLVRRSDDRIIGRLAFAVIEGGESSGPAEPMVVIRARPSKQLPPVLVVDGVACRPYLKIPNLFVPVGKRIHPPLRRDAVARLLAGRSDQITWLMPRGEGGFTPQSIPDAAFRPMSDWIDYVIDHEAKPLQAWIASHRFDFEHFVCSEDVEPNKPDPKKPVRRPLRNSGSQVESEGGSSDVSPSAKKSKNPVPRKTSLPESDFSPTPKKKPKQDELQRQLRGLEQRFLQSDEPLDSPERALMWRQMSRVNALLRHRNDATICRVNSLWENAATDKSALTEWLQCEQTCSDVGRLTLTAIDELLAQRVGRSAQPCLIASYLVWAASQDDPPAEISDRQTQLTEFVLRHENRVPVRVAWLAWCALCKMSGNDVLLLARARDRLLERLFNQGLAPEFDMAAFMRTGGGDSDRFRTLKGQIIEICEMAQSWIIEPTGSGDPQTKLYAKLVFSYALARLGETAQCNELIDRVGEVLCGDDPIHRWVYNAYKMRVQQALAGQASQGHLSDDLRQQLDAMDQMDRYKIDRLRQLSRILEPHIKIDPFKNYHQRYADELSRELAAMQNVVDREELSDRISRLMQNHPSGADRMRILPDALQLSAHVGEKLASSLLALVPEVIDHCKQSMEKALLLQRAIHIAAHYGRVDLVHGYVVALDQALPDIVAAYLSIDSRTTPENKELSDATESLLAQSFRGLRKLGMRDEIGRLYGTVADLVAGGKAGKTAITRRRGTIGEASRSQRLLLCVAGGWYYFGDVQSASKIVDDVGKLLRSGDLPAVEQKGLASAYLAAVSQAPASDALHRVQQFFAVNKKGRPEIPGIEDSMSTSTHFSISQMEVIEAAVMSLVSDDFALTDEARRWLDEDEFLVRRRIHRDMRAASGS